MKKLKLVLAALLAFIFISVKGQAQTAVSNSFAGKWDILAKGIPGGDKHIIFDVEDKDGKLGGTMTDPETKAVTPLTKVEKDDKGITLYFTAQGYDVSLVLHKTDEDHVTGSMMGMFDCTGERVKQ